MTAKKGARKAKGEGAKKPRLLSEPKVLRVIHECGWDQDKFKLAWEAAAGTRVRGASIPTPEQIKAVEMFVADGDLGALTSQLGMKNVSTVNAIIARVLAWKARH